MNNPYIHPCWLEEAALLQSCDIYRGRASGPGGQHRNKVETAVEVRHRDTLISGWASERRSQKENKGMAIKRLRMNLALEYRRELERDHLWLQANGEWINAPYEVSTLWKSRLQGQKLSISPKSKDLPAFLAEALDVISDCHHEVKSASLILGCSQSQLIRLLRHEPRALQQVNEARQLLGLRDLN